VPVFITFSKLVSTVTAGLWAGVAVYAQAEPLMELMLMPILLDNQ